MLCGLRIKSTPAGRSRADQASFMFDGTQHAGREPANVFRTSRQSASIKTSHSGQNWPASAPGQGALVNARQRPLGFRPVDLEPAESEQILVGDTIDLDGRRGMAAQKTTRMRRQLSMVYAADATLRQEELDILLAAAPATGWGEAVAKARYLLILFAQTPAAEDPRRATLIADVFADFKRLLAESNTPTCRG
jgi:hypothetical protein